MNLATDCNVCFYQAAVVAVFNAHYSGNYKLDILVNKSVQMLSLSLSPAFSDIIRMRKVTLFFFILTMPKFVLVLVNVDL